MQKETFNSSTKDAMWQIPEILPLFRLHSVESAPQDGCALNEIGGCREPAQSHEFQHRSASTFGHPHKGDQGCRNVGRIIAHTKRAGRILCCMKSVGRSSVAPSPCAVTPGWPPFSEWEGVATERSEHNCNATVNKNTARRSSRALRLHKQQFDRGIAAVRLRPQQAPADRSRKPCSSPVKSRGLALRVARVPARGVEHLKVFSIARYSRLSLYNQLTPEDWP
eukprot:902879-Rhodomonas_salina.2